jgi:hypothetical protein
MLILKRASTSRPSGQWKDEDYDVLADGKVVGRIYERGSAHEPELVPPQLQLDISMWPSPPVTLFSSFTLSSALCFLFSASGCGEMVVSCFFS